MEMAGMQAMMTQGIDLGNPRDRELLERFGREFAALDGGEPVCLELPPAVAWNALALLQLALRYPALVGTGVALDGALLVEALKSAVAPSGARAEVAARGDGPGGSPWPVGGAPC